MRKRDRFRLALKLSGVLCAALAGAGGAEAAQLVTFSHGQYLVVQSAEKRGAWYYLVLEGGGQMGVPAGRVASIEEYEPPPGASTASATQFNRGVGAASPAQQPAGRGIMAAGNPALPAAAGQPGAAVGAPAAAQPNVATQGNEDWRYKTRMSGGPKRQLPSFYGAGAAGVKGTQTGKRVPPGAMRRPPPKE